MSTNCPHFFLSMWDVHTLQVEIPAQDANVVSRLVTDCDIVIALQPTGMEEEFHALKPFAKLPYCPSIGKKNQILVCTEIGALPNPDWVLQEYVLYGLYTVIHRFVVDISCV